MLKSQESLSESVLVNVPEDGFERSRICEFCFDLGSRKRLEADIPLVMLTCPFRRSPSMMYQLTERLLVNSWFLDLL